MAKMYESASYTVADFMRSPGQAWWRHNIMTNSLGLGPVYTDKSSDTAHWLKLFFVLPLLPIPMKFPTLSLLTSCQIRRPRLTLLWSLLTRLRSWKLHWCGC